MITVYELGPSDIQKILANYFGAEIEDVKVGVQDRYRYTDEEGYSEAFANVIIRKGRIKNVRSPLIMRIFHLKPFAESSGLEERSCGRFRIFLRNLESEELIMNNLYDLTAKETAYQFCEKYNMTASVSDEPAGMVFDRYIDKLCEVKNKDVY